MMVKLFEMTTLPRYVAFRTDDFEEFGKYGIEVYYAYDFSFPVDQLLADIFFEHDVNGLVYFCPLLLILIR